MQQNFIKSELEPDLGYKQILSILVRRRFWVVGGFVVALLVAAGITTNTEPTFQSKMQLLVEPDFSDPTNLQETLGTQQDTLSKNQFDVGYATQLTLMRSSQFIEKAASLLQLQYPEIEAEQIEANFQLFQVEQDKIKTKIFQAVYKDNDPLKTKTVLETLQRVYQDYNAAQINLRIDRGLGFINRELPQANDRYLNVETRLKDFRQNNNIIDPQQEATIVSQSLSDIERERFIIRAQYQDTLARYNALEKQLQFSPQQALIIFRLSESERYQTILNELQKTELELKQQLSIFTENAPQVQDLKDKRERQLSLLQEGISTVAAGIDTVATLSAEDILKQGQQGSTELELAKKLVETNREILGLQARERKLAESEKELRSRLNRLSTMIADYERLKPELEIQRDTIKQLLQTRQNLSLELSQGGFRWQVVEAAQLGIKVSPSLLKNMLLGMVVGGFLGGVAAFIREAMDDTIRSSEDLKQRVGLPLLGTVPDLSLAKFNNSVVNFTFRRKIKPAELSVTQVVDSLSFRESVDLIYKNMQLSSGSVIKSLLVTSAKTGEGKSTLALGLAMSAARLDQRVLLVDADLRSPSLHEHLNLPNDQGLSDLLSAGRFMVPKIYDITLSKVNINVLTAGTKPTDPVKLLSSQRMRELMEGFADSYDLVILDSSSVLGVADALQVASFCSGVVMAVRLNEIGETELTQAIVTLNRFNLIGLAANRGSNPGNGYLLDRVEQNGSSVLEQQNSLLRT
jgi:polysaccharide biosynthesis transport protein